MNINFRQMKKLINYFILALLSLNSCVENPKKKFIGHESYVNTIDISSDEKYLASGGSNKRLNIWDIKSGKLIKTINAHKNRINFISFYNDAKNIISTGNDSRIYAWDVKTGKKEATYISEVGQFSDLKIATNDLFFTTTEYNVKNHKNKLLIIETQSFDIKKSIQNVGEYTLISPDNEFVFYSNPKDEKIMAYSINEDSSFVFVENTLTEPICISSDKKYIAVHPSNFNDYFIEIFDFMSAERISKINFEHISLPQYRNTKFTPDNKNISIIIDNKICVYDIKTGELQAEIYNNNYKMQIKDFLFCSNNQIIIAYEYDSDNLIMLDY